MENCSFIFKIQESIKHNWSSTAIVEPSVKETSYANIAEGIEQLHIFWHSAGLVQGDKIAICAKNSAEWIIKYIAAIVGGYVAVLIPNNVDSDQIWKIVIHSKSKILYADKGVLDSISPMVLSGSCLVSDIKVTGIPGTVQNNGLKPEEVCYPSFSSDAICTIMYTSGTTGDSRGAMLSYGYMDVNISKGTSITTHSKGESDVCVSPFFHFIGLFVNLLIPLCCGMRIIIPENPNPISLCETMHKYKPRSLYCVPIILCNLIKYIIDSNSSSSGYEELSDILAESLGGNIEAIVTGGSAIPEDFETLLIDRLNFPIVTAYGSTEGGCISVGVIGKYKQGSCGTIIKDYLIRIDSTGTPHSIGEIQLKDIIFSGYYDNDAANRQSFTEDGWFKTGDLGYIDEDGSLFITGRCKDMLLASNGENIYPEGIESTMNSSSFVKESILVQKGEKLYAIVVPDREKAEAEGLDSESLNRKIDEVVREAGKKLPGFTVISGFELRDEPFERTPKGSLKRYLYSDGFQEN